MTTNELPKMMKALVLQGYGKPSLETIPVPTVLPGSVIIKVLHCLVNNNVSDILDGTMPFPMVQPYPAVFGSYGVGRVVVPGPDTTAFKAGQLIVFEPFVRARDDPDVAMLMGGMDGVDEKTKKFTAENWRDGCWAEYTRLPLENTWAVDEEAITKLGLKTHDLVHIGPLGVVYGGLRKIDVKPGETVVISPATGFFSGGAVSVARSMGANVIAASRSAEGLKSLAAKYPGLKTVQLDEDNPEAVTQKLKAFGPIDAFVDISSYVAINSPHLGPLMMSVRRGGRVCLMGGRMDATLPYSYIMMLLNDLTIRGSWMFERKHMYRLVKMVESRTLRLDKEGGMEVRGSYTLDNYKEAVVEAKKNSAGNIVVLDL